MRREIIVTNVKYMYVVNEVIIEDLRFEYENEIEYESDFSILVCRLHVTTSHTHLIP